MPPAPSLPRRTLGRGAPACPSAAASSPNAQALGANGCCPFAPASARSVHIVCENDRPTGMALVEFASTQEAQMGMSKDKQMMGTRYIEVFNSSRCEARLGP